MKGRDWDRRDKAFHDADGEEAIQTIIRRHLKWIATQPAHVQRLFCEHGRYVGAGRALDFMCPKCPER